MYERTVYPLLGRGLCIFGYMGYNCITLVQNMIWLLLFGELSVLKRARWMTSTLDDKLTKEGLWWLCIVST